MPVSECPTGCGRTRADGHLLCRRCWSRVPPDLQDMVWRTWRAWQRDRGDAEKMMAYTEAAQAAASAAG